MEGQESGPRLHAEVEGDFRPNPRRRMECLFKMMTFTLGRILGKIHLLLCYHFSICKMGTKTELAFFEVEKNDGFKFHFLTTKHEGREGVKGRCRGHWMEWSWAS